VCTMKGKCSVHDEGKVYTMRGKCSVHNRGEV